MATDTFPANGPFLELSAKERVVCKSQRSVFNKNGPFACKWTVFEKKTGLAGKWTVFGVECKREGSVQKAQMFSFSKVNLLKIVDVSVTFPNFFSQQLFPKTA